MWWCNIWENGMDIMGIKRKWLYYGNRVRLTETMRDLLLNSKYLQLCLNIGFRHLRVNNQTILWGGRGRLAPGYLRCSKLCPLLLVASLHSTAVSLTRLLLPLRPVRPLRLTLTDVASASSRDQSLRSPPESDCGRLWSWPESWKQH